MWNGDNGRFEKENALQAITIKKNCWSMYEAVEHLVWSMLCQLGVFIVQYTEAAEKVQMREKNH